MGRAGGAHSAGARRLCTQNNSPIFVIVQARIGSRESNCMVFLVVFGLFLDFLWRAKTSKLLRQELRLSSDGGPNESETSPKWADGRPMRDRRARMTRGPQGSDAGYPERSRLHPGNHSPRGEAATGDSFSCRGCIGIHRHPPARCIGIHRHPPASTGLHWHLPASADACWHPLTSADFR